MKEFDVVVGKVKEKLEEETEMNVDCSIHPCAHFGDERRIASHL